MIRREPCRRGSLSGLSFRDMRIRKPLIGGLWRNSHKGLVVGAFSPPQSPHVVSPCLPIPRQFELQRTARALLSLSASWTLASSCLVGCLVQQAYGHGAYHDVVDGIQAELRLRPGDAALRYRLAEAHVGHEEWRACLKELKLVERLAPGIYQTGYLRGLALHIAGSGEEAKRELDDFIKVNPDHVNALATRGRVFLKLELPSEAAADLQKAVRHAKVPESQMVLDLALAFRNSGKPAEASAAIDAGLTKSGNAPSLLLYALEFESEAGTWDSALRRIDALEKSAPRPEPWMAERARLLTRAGRADAARAAWLALLNHLNSLPNLDRGTPQNSQLLTESRHALGETIAKPVAAPPAS